MRLLDAPPRSSLLPDDMITGLACEPREYARAGQPTSHIGIVAVLSTTRKATSRRLICGRRRGALQDRCHSTIGLTAESLKFVADVDVPAQLAAPDGRWQLPRCVCGLTGLGEEGDFGESLLLGCLHAFAIPQALERQPIGGECALSRNRLGPVTDPHRVRLPPSALIASSPRDAVVLGINRTGYLVCCRRESREQGLQFWTRTRSGTHSEPPTPTKLGPSLRDLPCPVQERDPAL